ncbi:MAG: hypothetical protein P1V97_12145 [Planctomycetota bacterium]|nr:hypothetical protein [Planctomycetota bacterium]
MLDLFERRRKNGGKDFIHVFEEMAQDQFNELEKNGSPRQLYHFYENYYTLYSSTSALKELSAKATHLRRMLQFEKNARGTHKFLHIHYKLQQLDLEHQLTPHNKLYCDDRMKVSLYSLQEFIRKISIARRNDVDRSLSDQLIYFMTFCLRSGIYLEEMDSGPIGSNLSLLAYLQKQMQLRPWDPSLKLLYLNSEFPQQSYNQSSISAFLGEPVQTIFNEITQSKKIPSAYRASLLYKRANLRYYKITYTAFNRREESNKLGLKLVLEDLQAAYKLGLPRIYKTAHIYHMAMTFNLNPQQTKALKKPLLDQFEIFSKTLDQHAKLSNKVFKLGDSQIRLSQSQLDVSFQKSDLTTEYAHLYRDLEEYEMALNLLLRKDTIYTTLKDLELMSYIVKKANKVDRLEEVLQRMRKHAGSSADFRKQRHLSLIKNLEKHFKNRK